MSWARKTINNMDISHEAITLDGDSDVKSSEIDFIKDNLGVVTIGCKAQTSPNGNVSVDVYAAYKSGGTYALIYSTVVGAFADANLHYGVIDLSQYPAPFYKINLVSSSGGDTDVIDVRIMR